MRRKGGSAALATWGSRDIAPMSGFSVAGQRIVVVGGGRSGMPAARLLARRGARVTLIDQRDELDEASTLAAEGIAVELGGIGWKH